MQLPEYSASAARRSHPREYSYHAEQHALIASTQLLVAGFSLKSCIAGQGAGREGPILEPTEEAVHVTLEKAVPGGGGGGGRRASAPWADDAEAPGTLMLAGSECLVGRTKPSTCGEFTKRIKKPSFPIF